MITIWIVLKRRGKREEGREEEERERRDEEGRKARDVA